jgi:hypothetical protein
MTYGGQAALVKIGSVNLGIEISYASPLEAALLTSGIREEDLKLKDKKEVSMPVNTTNILSRPVIDINRYSSFIRVMRVIASIRRVCEFRLMSMLMFC